MISDQAEVCTIFNSFFANVATDIGKDCHIDNMEDHPSIQKIKQNLPTNTPKFSFQLVSGSEINKILSSIDSKKSTGADNIPAKIDKSCISPISGVLANLINTTCQQLLDYFNNIFNPFLAAFRKGFWCQSTLLRLLEDWRKALDNHKSAAAVLMDLSKAFDCLPHGLLIEKLRA